MSKKYSTFDVIERFKTIHGDRYDYAKFEYRNNKLIPGIIICREHGEFQQNRMHHEKGSGCPVCANVPVGGFKRKTNQQFLDEMVELFGNVYDFSKFEYINNKTHSIVKCSIHGDFSKTPKALLLGQGCPACSGKKKLTKENIQIRLDNIHGANKYNVDQFDYINNKTKGVVNCSTHGNWETRIDNLLNLEQRCPKCASINSKSELELQEFITSLGLEQINNSRNIITPLELDIYIPSKNIAIEFNGLYYHSELSGKDKHYHLNKTNLCTDKNIQLLHIFEDEWIDKKELWKSVIKSKLGMIDHRIYARKCEVRKVSTHDAGKFLSENHLQGSSNSSVKLGLYHNNSLVAIMTFCKSRYDSTIEWEISQFCNKMNSVVVGGFDKIFKCFIQQYNPNSIVSYADKRYSDGNVYKNRGLVEYECKAINYFYFKKSETRRYSRQMFQKHKLVNILSEYNPDLSEWQNMQLNGYDRIWDCGNKKFVWLQNN